MNALNMMIFPTGLLFRSSSVSAASETSAPPERSQAAAMVYFLSTTALASLVGLIIPRLIHLGRGVSFEMATADIQATEMSSILDTIKNLIPSNPVKAFAEGNMLQVLVFAVIIGFTLICHRRKRRTTSLIVIDSLNESLPEDHQHDHVLYPYRCFLYDRTSRRSKRNRNYHLTGNTAHHSCISHSLLLLFSCMALSVKILGKESPLRFFKAIMPAALNAFGTCSSSATIPLSKQCMEEEMGVSNQDHQYCHSTRSYW